MKRFKDLSTTAMAPSSDDYFLLDGTTNGTRKILADLPVSTATQSALNNKANLSGATFTGSITATNLSGTNTGDQDLSGLVPKTTTVNGHALSSNVTVTATDTGAPTISSGSGAPTSTPTKVGDIYIDTTNYKTYIAKGTSSSSDWIKQNGSYVLLAGTPNLLNPANGSVYYWGSSIGWATLSGGYRRLYISRAGTISSVRGMFQQTAGSSEASSLYLRVNDTTNYLVSSSIVNNATITTFLSNSEFSIPVSAGDFVEFLWTCPTWATKPTNINPSATIGIDL